MPRFRNGLLKPVFVIQKNKEAYSEALSNIQKGAFCENSWPWMAVSKVCEKLHLRCLTGLSQGLNTSLELHNLFTSVFVRDSLNILIILILKETRNSFKKWPLNLWWTSNKTIMEIRNITKTASFKSFLHLSYKSTQLLLLWLCFFIFFHETNINWSDDFWGLHKSINYAFSLMFTYLTENRE